MRIPAAVVDAIRKRFEREGRAIYSHQFPDGAAAGFDLWGGPGAGHVLRSDGDVFEWGWDIDDVTKLRLADDHSALQGLSIAMKRLPELAPALPVRPSSSRECAKCDGHGFLDIGDKPKFLVCDECDGLGWLAA